MKNPVNRQKFLELNRLLSWILSDQIGEAEKNFGGPYPFISKGRCSAVICLGLKAGISLKKKDSVLKSAEFQFLLRDKWL